jgi:phosphatidate cytidylyltransferase
LLRTRIITAVSLAPLALVLVFLAPTWVFRLAAAFLLLIGSWEFSRLAGLRSITAWLLPGIQTALLALMVVNWDILSGNASLILIASCAAWILMFLRMYGFHDDQAPDRFYRVSSFISALMAISSCWFALAWLRDQAHGEFLIFLLLIIIWAADIGAYFGGKQFGKTQLAPSISPKKTWEGVFGGFLLSGLAAIFLNHLTPAINADFITVLILTAVTVTASICGDLFISVHKRTVKIKDAGHLFPGHGGVLDRFDSLLPGASFFAAVIWYLGS